MTYPIVYAGPVRDTALPIVYGLADPREPDRIRYVGMTASPATRYSDHIGGSGGGVRPRWVNDLRRKKLFPLMLLLQKCDSTEVAAGAESGYGPLAKPTLTMHGSLGGGFAIIPNLQRRAPDDPHPG